MGSNGSVTLVGHSLGGCMVMGAAADAAVAAAVGVVLLLETIMMVDLNGMVRRRMQFRVV
jgi:thioesterase domain-containing protein